MSRSGSAPAGRRPGGWEDATPVGSPTAATRGPVGRRIAFGGAAAAAAVAPALSRPARAQAPTGPYPERPVRLIVPWAPGGSTDILARVVAEHLGPALGQPVVIENRSGASGNVGSELVAKAPPDGHTILFGSMSTHAMNPALMRGMPFDGVADFTPVALLAYVLNTMVVHPSVPAATVAEFVAHAKAHPDRIAYASGGPGSTNHLCGALFERMAGVRMVHVPYRGGAPAVLDTVAGQAQLFFSAGTQTLPHARAGRLRLLAVTEARRSALLPEAPTVAETLPGYEMTVWYGCFGPRGLPPPVTARLNAEINRVLALPDVARRMAEIGVEVRAEPPEALGTLLRADAEKWGGLIRQLGIRAE